MQVMNILVRPVRVNLASDILRHSSALFCDILLLYSPDSAIFSDMREICWSFFPVRILAGGSCEMRESLAECVRVGNYASAFFCILNFFKFSSREQSYESVYQI